MCRNLDDLHQWVNCINLVAAMFSSPPLPGGIGSSKTFRRPLLPVSKTCYTPQEQLEYHRKHVKQLQTELAKLDSNTGAFHTFVKPNSTVSHTTNAVTSFDNDKYNYLKFEVAFSLSLSLYLFFIASSLTDNVFAFV